MYVHPLYHWPGKGRWTQARSESRRWSEFSAYVHFPYCRSICGFCGYETRLITRDGARQFPELACEQIVHHGRKDDFSGAQLRSVFFGGGTASLMPSGAILQILEAVRSLPSLAGAPEITLECEPGTISRDRLRAMKAAGVNRVSVCAQALDDNELDRIGRKHNTRDSLKLIDDCVAVGINNIHLDLMYGLPDQSLADWERTLHQLEHLPIAHLSTYKLYVFRQGSLHRRGTVPLPEAESEAATDLLRRMHDTSREIAEATGLEQYSLTEYARRGLRSIYILDTFTGRDILPIGPSAFGRCAEEVYDNSPYVHLYGSARATEFDRAYRMSRLEAFKRDVILGLWLLNVPLEAIAIRRGVRIAERLRSTLQELELRDALRFDGRCVSLEPRHRFNIGAVMAELAELDAVEWGEDLSPSERSDGVTAWPEYTVIVSPSVNSILRTARRDQEFFRALCADPDAVLNSFDTGLERSEFEQLCEVIKGPEKLTHEALPLRQIWRHVAAEHART